MTESTAGLVRVPAELPEVRILRLQPGDVLVLQCEKFLDREEAHYITQQLAARFPGHEAIVLDGGVTLDIARREGE